MSSITSTETQYTIVQSFNGWFRVINETTGQFLSGRNGVRQFRSRSGARKAITRERSGNFS